jgi:hypothetical protein
MQAVSNDDRDWQGLRLHQQLAHTRLITDMDKKNKAIVVYLSN